VRRLVSHFHCHPTTLTEQPRAADNNWRVPTVVCTEVRLALQKEPANESAQQLLDSLNKSP